MGSTIDTSVAEATAPAVSNIAAGFMLDGATYAKGGELGFQGLSFYFAGRCGVLGDVDPEVVASSLVFFSPPTVAGAWDASKDTMPRRDASAAFGQCMASWAAAHLDDSVDWARLAELASKITGEARAAGAPLFAAWRGLAIEGDDKVRALYQLNLLRELRMARHGAAVTALGIRPDDAVRHRSPHMVPIFGWDAGEVPASVVEEWEEAERLTNQATARDYAVLTPEEAAELVDMCRAAQSAVH